MYTPNYSRGSNGRFESKLLSDRELSEMAMEIGKRLYKELLALDPENGEAWFDDDNNIPAFGNTVARNKLLRERIAELKGQMVGNELSLELNAVRENVNA